MAALTTALRAEAVLLLVVVADPPRDIDSDSDSDNKYFDALSDSHCVECQIEYLGSYFDHCDLDSESGQSSDESELDDNGLEQNTVNKIYSPLSQRDPNHHQTQVQKLYKEYEFIYEVLPYSHS